MAKSDIEIAREASMLPIGEIGDKLSIPSDALLPFGHTKAKVSLDYIESIQGNTDGKLILVTAISPTPAGEGKTTTSIGLSDGLNRIGKKTMTCLREPSLGPCFGMKGGAAGGGYAQVVPMEDINLHFTGDFHAIGAAHNLLSALVDNHIYWDNALDIDVRRINWGRVVDMNDRSLRDIVTSLGGVTNGFPRQTGFDITVASEVMAIFCLASDIHDLERRLGNIIIGYNRKRKAVTAADVKAHGPMTVLLKDAFMPNLVQTLENNPVFIHGGPFANIAHGCNSMMATKTALKLADYVVTEAGFGADLGSEKFMDIKCRKGGFAPSTVVIVATARALKMNGGVAKSDLVGEDVDAVVRGCENIGRHIRNVKSFGVPVIVAVNGFVTDTVNEIKAIQDYCQQYDVDVVPCTHWSDGGAGTEELATKVAAMVDADTGNFKMLYEDDLPLLEKARKIAQNLYGAEDISYDKAVETSIKQFEKNGFGHLPVCMAKTQYSFSTDPTALGAPTGHTIGIREARLSAGAEFVVLVCGEIMTMPGLPRVPSADNICINSEGLVEGLF
ncbi:MAG: formate--tetrahydrofolate ligase [Saprospiraceae bacterium]|jgi:formate--tetrahydrofolate ligase